jgi:hypothetical protein
MSNSNQANGIPHWILDNKCCGGGGVAGGFRKNEGKLKVRLGASCCYNSFTEDFFTFIGNISFSINGCTWQLELFNQSLNYLNTIQLGFRHYFDKKKCSYKWRVY